MDNSTSRFLNIYCDESRQTADRYMVLGGLITVREYESAFQQAMQLFRQSNNMRAEFKWTKVSNQKIKEYTDLMDLYFSLSRSFHFKAIVIDTQELDNKKYNKNDNELGFYKLMYQFLLHSFGAYLNSTDQCVIHLDQRTTSKYPHGKNRQVAGLEPHIQIGRHPNRVRPPAFRHGALCERLHSRGRVAARQRLGAENQLRSD
ncbi:MAG: DUF3800 domain-containing protein [Anaerolineales bacterium]|nr:DUF3800 domain-containing protein [Anaerolineales bacterium]